MPAMILLAARLTAGVAPVRSRPRLIAAGGAG